MGVGVGIGVGVGEGVEVGTGSGVGRGVGEAVGGGDGLAVGPAVASNAGNSVVEEGGDGEIIGSGIDGPFWHPNSRATATRNENAIANLIIAFLSAFSMDIQVNGQDTYTLIGPIWRLPAFSSQQL